MDELPPQLRRHYERQQLPPERVQAILVAGRVVAAKRTAQRWWQVAIAASLLIGAGLASLATYQRTRAFPAAEIAGTVQNFFSGPEYQLDRISANHSDLTEWLRTHGGPDDFAVPAGLAGLPSYGCKVLTVRGQKVFLICFLLDAPPPSAAGGMPEKKMMTVTNPDGTMMKKSLPLVHLVVAPKNKFAANLQTNDPVLLSTGSEWHFTTWTRGDQLYLAAGAMPADRLAALTSSL